MAEGGDYAQHLRNAALAWMAAIAPAILGRRTTRCLAARQQPDPRRHAGGGANHAQAEKRAACIPRRAALAAMVEERGWTSACGALRIEGRYLARLIVSPVAKNMINTFFFNLEQIRAAAIRGPGEIQRYDSRRVGILGMQRMMGCWYPACSTGEPGHHHGARRRDLESRAAARGRPTA